MRAVRDCCRATYGSKAPGEENKNNPVKVKVGTPCYVCYGMSRCASYANSSNATKEKETAVESSLTSEDRTLVIGK